MLFVVGTKAANLALSRGTRPGAQAKLLCARRAQAAAAQQVLQCYRVRAAVRPAESLCAPLDARAGPSAMRRSHSHGQLAIDGQPFNSPLAAWLSDTPATNPHGPMAPSVSVCVCAMGFWSGGHNQAATGAPPNEEQRDKA